MGSAASLQTPELTSVFLTETKRSDRQIDLTDMKNDSNAIFIIVYNSKNIFLNDLQSCFDGVSTIPSYFNVKGRTWIPIDCSDTDVATAQFNVFAKTWKNLMRRIIAVGLYDGGRNCSFMEWRRGYSKFLVEVNLFGVSLLDSPIPQRFDHRVFRLKPFISGVSSLMLTIDEIFSC
jgi:hypothetical protein